MNAPPLPHDNTSGASITPGLLPPGPAPRTGLLDSLGYYYAFLTDSLGYVASRFEQYGDVYYAPSGGVGLYVLKHPDHIQQVLVSDAASYSKSHSALSSISQVLGDGLLTTDGAHWRRQRRMVQPAFTRARLAGYADKMVAEAVRVRDSWNDQQTREIGGEMMKLTLSIVGQTLFSQDVGGSSAQVAHAMEAFHRSLARPNFTPKWFPSRTRNQAQQAASTLDAIIYGLIADRRATTPLDPPDLLQMLLDAEDHDGDGGRLDDKEIRDQLITLFVAGHETTSHALSWTWFLLAQNPEARRKLQQELDEVLAGRTPRYEDLPNLPYTRCVLDEAMRLYPPAYSVARRAERDTVIGPYEVAAGSEVIVWIYMTHRDARWYPQPDIFRPERFLPEAISKRPKQAYLPFGAGARTCIGKMFALFEAQLIIATLAQRFELELLGGRVEPQTRITLAPKQLQMKLRAR